MNAAAVLLYLAMAAFAYKVLYNVVSFALIARRSARARRYQFHAQIEPFELFLIPVMAVSAIWADAPSVFRPLPVAVGSTAVMLLSYGSWFPMQRWAKAAIEKAGGRLEP